MMRYYIETPDIGTNRHLISRASRQGHGRTGILLGTLEENYLANATAPTLLRAQTFYAIACICPSMNSA